MTLLYSIPKVRGGVVRLETAVFRLAYGQRFGPGLRLFGLPIVSFAHGSTARFGRDLTLISHSCFSEPGVSHPVVLRTLRADATLIVGDNVGMSGSTVCAAERVTIGRDCLFGADVLVADTDFHRVEPYAARRGPEGVRTAPVEIADNVFLGARSMVLKGVHIGRNAVVAAGSVVTSDVPENAVAAGVPAQVVGWVTPEAGGGAEAHHGG